MTKRELLEALSGCGEEQEICILKGNKYLVVTGAYSDDIIVDELWQSIFVLETKYEL